MVANFGGGGKRKLTFYKNFYLIIGGAGFILGRIFLATENNTRSNGLHVHKEQSKVSKKWSKEMFFWGNNLIHRK